MKEYIETLTTAVSDPLKTDTAKAELDELYMKASEAISRAGGYRIISFDDIPLSLVNATFPLLWEFMPEQSILIQTVSNVTSPICPNNYGILIVIKIAHSTVAMPCMFFHEETDTYFCSYNQYNYNSYGTIPKWQRVNPGQFGGQRLTSGQDLNDLTYAGFYFNDIGTTGSSITNRPSDGTLFMVEVRNGPGKLNDSGSTNTRREQIFTDYTNGDIYVRFNVSYNSYSWGAWKKITS